MVILVTGAAGFIGSNLVHLLLAERPDVRVVSYDALTYAGNLENLEAALDNPRHEFVRGDIADVEQVRACFSRFEIDAVMHLAAESHVDRSIVDPLGFVRTNVQGTATLLLEASRAWDGRKDVRFLHVSTDEVFGALGPEAEPFDESTPYDPHSPYSASKAASDHLVRAWFDTYELPVLITNCTNNYGPRQFPEKLIPLVISRAVKDEPIPVYGRGENVRDWLFVEDHCRALLTVLEKGEPGETYCVGGETEVSNLDLVGRILDIVDLQLGRQEGTSRRLITFVEDRPGHDFRYAMDISRIQRDLGWSPAIPIDRGLAQTISWYIEHQDWAERARSGEAKAFEAKWYNDRVAKGSRVDDEIS